MVKGVINKVSTSEKVVAITFDDGPNPVYTPQVLEIFEAVSGKATFFMIGEQLEKHPEVAKLVAEKGHEIGNHTYTHPNLTELSEADAHKELAQTESKIEELIGAKPTIMRPPFFGFNEYVQKVVDQFDYPVIGALNGEATDWEMPGVDPIYSKSLKHADNGSILIFHDGFGDRSQSVEAVRLLVNKLHGQGFQFVTVSELLKLGAE